MNMMDSIEEKPSLSALNSKVELKLFINKANQKVLYAESDKEFVDFLFSLVSLPLGMVISVLQNSDTLGSISDLCNSIQSLNKTYLIDQLSPDNLSSVLNLNPSGTSLSTTSKKTVTASAKNKRIKGKVYMCPQCVMAKNRTKYVADDPNTICPYCPLKMTCAAQFVGKDNRGAGAADQKGTTSSGLGFVKEMVTYMVMDNLEVKPLSTVSTLALLNSFDIRDLTSIQEMVVHVGFAEGLKLLEESLQSKDVLTNVFLAKRSKRKTLLTL